MRRFAIGSAIVAPVLVIGALFAGNYAIKTHERAAKADAANRIRRQTADVKSGKQRFVVLSNELDTFAFSEFVKSRGDLGQANPYELQVCYSNDTDCFLRQIAGIRGVRSLVLYKTDVSDDGIEFVATMPELTEVRIGKNLRTSVTGEKLAELRVRLPQCTISVGEDE